MNWWYWGWQHLTCSEWCSSPSVWTTPWGSSYLELNLGEASIHWRSRLTLSCKSLQAGEMVCQENSKVQQQSPSLRWSNPYCNTSVGLAKRQLCRKQLEAFGDGKLHRSQQSTLAAVQVNLLLGCFSPGIAGEDNYSHGASQEILHSFQGHPAQERHGQTGPGSVESHQIAWQLGDMTCMERELGLQEWKSSRVLTTFHCPRWSYREGKPSPSQRHREK